MTIDEYQTLAGRDTDPRKVYTLKEMPEDLKQGLLKLADEFPGDDERR